APQVGRQAHLRQRPAGQIEGETLDGAGAEVPAGDDASGIDAAQGLGHGRRLLEGCRVRIAIVVPRAEAPATVSPRTMARRTSPVAKEYPHEREGRDQDRPARDGEPAQLVPVRPV